MSNAAKYLTIAVVVIVVIAIAFRTTQGRKLLAVDKSA